MDPNETLAAILGDLQSCARQDSKGCDTKELRSDIIENLGNLADWLRKGGFAPVLPGSFPQGNPNAGGSEAL